MTRKLNQVIAVEKGIKNRTNAELTALHRIAEKTDLLNGFTKTYQSVEEEGQGMPPQAQRVQYTAESLLADARKLLADLFDVTATKDWGNQSARADVLIDGTALLTGVPATYLLFLDKQLTDLNTFVTKIVELDPAVDWAVDSTTGMFKSTPLKSHRTEKKEMPLVLFPATDKHPAQTKTIVEDRLVGYWTTIKQSGAIPAPQKKAIVARVIKLQQAVKSALEQANMVEVSEQQVSNKLFSFLIDG